MTPLRRFSGQARPYLNLLFTKSIPRKYLLPNIFTSYSRYVITQAPGSLVNLFLTKNKNKKGSILNHRDAEMRKISVQKVVEPLMFEILRCRDSQAELEKILAAKGCDLLRMCPDGSAGLELLNQLEHDLELALEVFGWRRKWDSVTPLTPEEYAKGIKIAGRLKRTDMASCFFVEAVEKKIKSVFIYNAMMGAYLFNESLDKCQSVFKELRRDPDCRPSIVSYNILLAALGRMMLVDHMEDQFKELKDLNLKPNVNTYNILMSGYVTAWMWDSMERTYSLMKANFVKPDSKTHLIMLRGYAHSGNMKKMEEMYHLVKDRFAEVDPVVIRLMVIAYCKSELTGRVEKIEALLKFIPESEYRTWLNVMLIKVYAQEDLLESMDKVIDKAFKHHTVVVSKDIMRSILGCYFRSGALDRLESFVSRVETSGWKICRSIYHCKMVMYGLRSLLKEMEYVLNEMHAVQLSPTQRTFLIMSKAYRNCGEIAKAKQVVGLMYRYGYDVPMMKELS